MSTATAARNPEPVLFICTGNYYRSRFAEAVFNHQAAACRLPWRAVSRGLTAHVVEGDLSPLTAAALATRGIPLSRTAATRAQLTDADLHQAARRIAMSREEHYPMMQRLFPDWADRIDYWEVEDIADTPPHLGLAAIEQHVAQLLAALPE